MHNQFSFYYPDGTFCESRDAKELFLNFYSQAYYILPSTDITTEKNMLRCLESDQIDAKDLKDILNWKSGNRFVSDYDNLYKDIANDLSKECITAIDSIGHDNWSDSIKKYLVVLCKHLYRNKCDNTSEHTYKGIGPTYAITIAYFHSCGKLPIYDRFAFYGINAICNITNPYKKYDHKLDHNIYSSNLEFVIKKYAKYCNMIYSQFKYEYESMKNSMEIWRKVDQALWTYGHLFNLNKSACRGFDIIDSYNRILFEKPLSQIKDGIHMR